MDDCVFCKIINNEAPSDKVYEDEHTVAFLTLHPDTPGHTLVIPKDHFENMYGITDEAMARLALSVKKVAVAVKNGLEADGLNVVMNNESIAGQIVFHVHIHIIPRYGNKKEISKKEIVKKIKAVIG
jgi:histidine triad (HIT) family protein